MPLGSQYIGHINNSLFCGRYLCIGSGNSFPSGGTANLFKYHKIAVSKKNHYNARHQYYSSYYIAVGYVSWFYVVDYSTYWCGHILFVKRSADSLHHCRKN